MEQCREVHRDDYQLAQLAKTALQKKTSQCAGSHADDAPTSCDLKNAQRVQGYNVHR
jgi:hypothetical protein